MLSLPINIDFHVTIKKAHNFCGDPIKSLKASVDQTRTLV